MAFVVLAASLQAQVVVFDADFNASVAVSGTLTTNATDANLNAGTLAGSWSQSVPSGAVIANVSHTNNAFVFDHGISGDPATLATGVFTEPVSLAAGGELTLELQLYASRQGGGRLVGLALRNSAGDYAYVLFYGLDNTKNFKWVNTNGTTTLITTNGISSNTGFLNPAVDNYLTWPSGTLIRVKLQVLPQTTVGGTNGALLCVDWNSDGDYADAGEVNGAAFGPFAAGLTTIGSFELFFAGSTGTRGIYLDNIRATATRPTVVNTNDSGPGSLRQIIQDTAPGSTVVFATNLSGQTITLTSGQLTITNNLKIDASALANRITISGNSASRVMYITNANVTLDSLIISGGNAGGGSGGGIYNEFGGVLTLTHCTLTGNSAAQGGGICNRGTAISNSSTLSYNGANQGGAIYTDNWLELNNCTLAENSAASGGAIFNLYLFVSLRNSTLTGNSANVNGGGIYNYSGSLTFNNSIVVGNTAPANANIAGSSSGANNLTTGAPLLAPLGNYGGPTQTMPPLPGSPAIDAGSDSVTNTLATDQRGAPRLFGAHVDIGAVEVQTIVTTQPESITNLVGTTATFTVSASSAGTLTYQWRKNGNALADGGNVSGSASNTLSLSNVQLSDAADYTVSITNAYAGVTSAVATLTVVLPPVIVQEPQDAFAGCGTGAATFSVIATGSQPLSYQWRLNGVPIPGATATNYTVNPATFTNAGNYTVVVSNAYLAVTSSVALLNVQDTNPPVITLLGTNPLTNYVNHPLVDPGATALDACDGSVAVTTNSTVNVNVAGNYTITYTAGDSSGQSTNNVRTVVVVPLLVTTTNDGGFGSLRGVVAAALSGEVITFATELSGQTITLTSGQITITNNLSIDASALTNRITISGNNASRVFEVRSSNTVALDSLILREGKAVSGGGAIFNAGTLSILECTLTNNVTAPANNGDFAYSYGGNGGNASHGGALYNSGTLVILNSMIAGNHTGSGGVGGSSDYQGGDGGSGGDGGAIFSTGTLTIQHSTISGNGSGVGGAGGYGSSLAGGSGRGGHGGAIFSTGTMAIQNASITGNQTGSGGLSGTTGGGFYGSIGGIGGNGGGIYSSSTGVPSVVENSLIASNLTGQGGGSSSSLFPNERDYGGDGGRGAGIYCGLGAELIIRNTTLTGNASGNGGNGGRFGNGGNGGSGGGIYSSGSTLAILNASLCYNSTGLGGNSGASGGTNGSAGLGGGIYRSSGIVSLTNTIVAGNNAPTNANLYGSFFGFNNLTNGNPLLSPLGNYGGPTQTMPPLPGSPAIDAGDDSVTNNLATDQRGLPRLIGLHVDIGAVEAQLIFFTQPQSITNLAGTTANFIVMGAGAPPLAYQWLKAGNPLADGGNVSGATSNVLTLFNVQSSDATNYTVVITNAYGSVTSGVATLTVICLNITVSGTPPPSLLVGQNVMSYLFTAFSDAGPGNLTLFASGLPPGLLPGMQSGNTLPINGSPSAPGTYVVTVTAQDMFTSCSGSLVYTQAVICPEFTFSPETLPPTTPRAVTVPYSQTLTVNYPGQGMADTILYGVVSGSLPPDIGLLSNGSFYGSASVNSTGTYNFTVGATNQYGCTGTKTYTLSIVPPPPPTISQPPRIENGNFLVTFSGLAYAFYAIEYRANLGPGSWQNFTNVTASPIGEIVFSTPVTDSPMRFFRAIPAP